MKIGIISWLLLSIIQIILFEELNADKSTGQSYHLEADLPKYVLGGDTIAFNLTLSNPNEIPEHLHVGIFIYMSLITQIVAKTEPLKRSDFVDGVYRGRLHFPESSVQARYKMKAYSHSKGFLTSRKIHAKIDRWFFAYQGTI